MNLNKLIAKMKKLEAKATEGEWGYLREWQYQNDYPWNISWATALITARGLSDDA